MLAETTARRPFMNQPKTPPIITSAALQSLKAAQSPALESGAAISDPIVRCEGLYLYSP